VLFDAEGPRLNERCRLGDMDHEGAPHGGAGPAISAMAAPALTGPEGSGNAERVARHGRCATRRVTTTPHDALFKAAFSKLRHARGLLRELLPAQVGERLDWRTLRLESGIAVDDEDLDEQRMDLVYSVRAGQRRVLLYVLAEHQSKVDPWMIFRLLCYLVAIWKGFRAQHPQAR
jgi:hypothetical protein